MAMQLVFAVIGKDRPGLVELLSGTVAGQGGNWLDSRMSVLSGQFAGVVLVSVPDARAEDLREALGRLEAEGVQVMVTAAPPARARRPVHAVYLELIGQDRPGIVQDISRVLHERDINIADLVTERMSGAMSGEALFKAVAELEIPEEVPTEAVREALQGLANEIMVDIDIVELKDEKAG